MRYEGDNEEKLSYGALIGVPGNREHWPKNSREQGTFA